VLGILAVLAAWPLTLITAAGYAAAWWRGWPPVKLARLAAWSLTGLAAWLALTATRPGLLRAQALTGVRSWAHWQPPPHWTEVARTFILLAPATLPAGLALAGRVWAWRTYAITTGLAGITASAPITFDRRQWKRQARTARGLTEAPGAVPLLARRRRIPVGGTIRTIGHRWHPVFTLPASALGRHMVIVGATGSGNPKYTGHMVYGRVRNRNGHRVAVPADQWLWSPQPVHPVIVDLDTWQAAQQIGKEHATSRDLPAPASPDTAVIVYPYRSRVRCRKCQRRACGQVYGRPGKTPNVYYQCPHRPDNPRHAAACPGHPRTVKIPQTILDQITGLFFAEHIFGPHRARLLAAQLPATDAAAAAGRDQQAAALAARIRQLDTAQNAQILSLEQLPADPADTAAAAMRARITARFAELHHDREQAQAQLNALAADTPKAADPTLLDELPLAGNILPGLDPALKARLFDSFDLQILWNKPGKQATVHVEITEATLQALPGILNPGQDGYDDTAETISDEAADGEDLFESPIGH